MLATSAQAFLFGPKGDSNAEKQSNIRQQRDEMLAQLYAANPEMKQVLKKAVGYATFKQVNVNLLLLVTLETLHTQADILELKYGTMRSETSAGQQVIETSQAIGLTFTTPAPAPGAAAPAPAPRLTFQFLTRPAN